MKSSRTQTLGAKTVLRRLALAGVSATLAGCLSGSQPPSAPVTPKSEPTGERSPAIATPSSPGELTPEGQAQDSATTTSPRPELHDLDGLWEGTLEIVHRDSTPPKAARTISFRLTINGENAGLQVGSQQGWSEIKPGKFRAHQHLSNAVVDATDDGKDADGTWVETQTIVLTKVSPSALRAIYVRLVNNLDMPRAKESADWWIVASGDLSRNSHTEAPANAMNYESEGNLQRTQTVGCIGLPDVKNSMTPADVYPAVAECIKLGKYDRASRLYAVAGTYARFDMLRVSDTSAHQAKSVLELNELGWISQEQRGALLAEVERTANDQGAHAEICRSVRALGPPSYYPRYMIQHGMGAFVGQKTPDGLIVGFEPTKAWNDALYNYIHCPRTK